MKTAAGLLLAVVFLALGALRIRSMHDSAAALEEMVSFGKAVENGIRFRAMTFSELVSHCEAKKYRFIDFSGEYPELDGSKEAVRLFSEFISQIGTTDSVGQEKICKAFLSESEELKSQIKQELKGKERVSGALTVFSALSALILFL